MALSVRALALVLLGLVSAMPTFAQADTVVGRWEVVDAPANGPGYTHLAFDADGTVRITYTSEELAEDPSAPTEARYAIAGDEITAVIEGDAATATFWFRKGDLYIRDGNGPALHLRRTSGC